MRNPDKKYTFLIRYLYAFKVKIKLRNMLNKSKTYTIGKNKDKTIKNEI